MTLRIVQVPNPAAGHDWSTAVPGQWLYHVIGVTAELITGGNVPVLVDSSGNANDGNYVTLIPGWPQNAPGLVAGDRAVITSNSQGAALRSYGNVPFPLVDWGADWTVEIWFLCLSTDPQVDYLWGASDPGAPWRLRAITNRLAGGYLQLIDALGGVNQSNDFVVPFDDRGHLLTVKNTAGAIKLFVDGALVPKTFTAAYGVPPTPATHVTLALNDVPPFGTNGTFDEWAIYNHAVSDARIAAHFAAASVSFQAYEAAVLADVPIAYYHLDDGPNPGRQVCLEITDGHQAVALVPTGFVELADGGPWLYSWQPGVQSNAETPAAGTYTVSIPDLILPAGYTIGTRTLDLAAGDQWTGILVWWDSDIMDALNPLNPYVFPPSVHLVYQQRTQPS